MTLNQKIKKQSLQLQELKCMRIEILTKRDKNCVIKEDKKCKHMEKCVVVKSLTFKNYKRVQTNGTIMYKERTFIYIQQEAYTIYTPIRDNDKR